MRTRVGSNAITAAVTIVLLTIASHSDAALISQDDLFFGTGSVTLDTATGLEWLDVTESRGRSFHDLSGADGTNEFNGGGSFPGWRYATDQDVIGFFDEAGVIGTFTGDSPAIQAFLVLTGSFTVGLTLHFNLSYYDDGIPGKVGRAGVVSFTGVRLGDDFYEITPNLDLALDIDPRRGNWLVRGGVPDPIPEPATLALMGLGLAGIGFSKRRKTPKVV